jgi:hypothetical protein
MPASVVSSETVPEMSEPLSICQEIGRAHGGRIDLTSEPGRGSTFTVRLPSSTAGLSGPPQPASESLQARNLW